MSAVVVVDHHAMTGGIPGPLDLDEPRQYPVELDLAFGCAAMGTLETSRLWAVVEDKAGAKVRAAYRAVRLAEPESIVFSSSEQVGLPLAIMDRRRRRHVLLAHNLTTPQKRGLQRMTGWLGLFDEIVVFSQHLGDYLTEEVGRDAGTVHVVPHPVDTAYFSPYRTGGDEHPAMILAVGREHRDYDTLFAALDLVPGVRATVVANSPWAKGTGLQTGVASGLCRKKSRVDFRPWVSGPELRELYAEATVVVAPLQGGTRFAAGVTSIVEAMAMGKAVVATSTPGIADHLYDDCVLSTVPGHAQSMADQIRALVVDHELRREMELSARKRATRTHTIEQFVARMRHIVESPYQGR